MATADIYQYVLFTLFDCWHRSNSWESSLRHSAHCTVLFHNSYNPWYPPSHSLTMLPFYQSITQITHGLFTTTPTRTSSVNRCLSLAGLPRLPGYWKCRTSPSKLRWRRNTAVVLMKCARLARVDNISVINLVPNFHPPTASSTFRDGFLFFNFIALLSL